MPTYTVVAHKDGAVSLLTAEQMDVRKDNKDEQVLGEFAAENSQEARRLFMMENPNVDASGKNMRVTVQVGDSPEADKQRAELHQSVMQDAVKDLKVPKGSDPDAYSDDAHIKRGEMLPKEERAKMREAQAASQPRGQEAVNQRFDGAATRNTPGNQPGNQPAQKWGNTGKQGDEKSSRAADGQGQGVVDAGSPNAGTAGPDATTDAGKGGAKR